jgi:HipA-like protein
MQLKLLIIGIDIFLEKRKTRMHVGNLKKENNQFVFTYNEKYLRAQNIIPLGPEFPLTKKQFKSKSLFTYFEDRIPSKKNPAYLEYCQTMNIDLKEDDPLILLSTIGKRGPSAFIFEPIYKRFLSIQDVLNFRKLLNLTTREFAHIFEISQASLNALERKRYSGKNLLKRLKIIIQFPSVSLYFLIINGGILSSNKWQNAATILKKMGADISTKKNL